MNNIQIRDAIIDTLVETAEAHHKAFSATEGEDPARLADMVCRSFIRQYA